MIPAYDDGQSTVYQGDALDVLRTLPDGIVQTCVTSPPYWGLRDYGADGQIGLEETPETYVTRLVEVFREVHRVLRDDGTLWLNLGDSYAGGGGYYSDAPSNRNGSKQSSNGGSIKGIRQTSTGIKPKDLVGIPWMVAFALRADGWFLRSDIIWSKPNAMPESVTDRPTKAHEYLFLLSKSPRYYYDHPAIQDAAVSDHPSGNGFKRPARLSYQDKNGARGNDQQWQVTATRNKRTVWEVPTTPYAGAHFATFPPKLIEPCILGRHLGIGRVCRVWRALGACGGTE